MTDIETIANRVETLGDITCPLCGETGFDIPGYLYSHRNGRNCEVEAACHGILPQNNAEVAQAVRDYLKVEK